MLKTLKGKASVASGILLASIASAHAALPTAATDAITGIGTDGLALIDAVWVPVAAVTTGFILIKLFKRGSGKI